MGSGVQGAQGLQAVTGRRLFDRLCGQNFRVRTANAGDSVGVRRLRELFTGKASKQTHAMQDRGAT